MRSFREFGIDGRDVQHCYQLPINPEDGRTRAAQVNVSGPKMLASVDRDRPLFYDAGADAVCALQVLGPHAAEPSSPILELACPHLFAAMRDCDAGVITKQEGISSFAEQRCIIDLSLLGR